MIAARLWAALGAIVSVFFLLTFSQVKAYRAGAAAERLATLNRSVEVLRERNATDDQTRNLDELAFVPLLAVAGCQTTVPASECDGWRKLTSAPQTRAYIIEHDRPFAEGVAAHNGFGTQRGCW